MSDLMLLGVLRMPIDPNSGPVALTQFFARAREAADRIESDAAEIERLRAALAQPPAPTVQPANSIEDPVTVPRGLLGAACSALDVGRDAPKTLAELRRYTIGDLSQPVQQPGAEPDGVLQTASLLEAMARNYAGGHSWDHLDGKACLRAAEMLRKLLPASPAQRQPLTQDEILDMAEGVSLQFHDLLEFARAIEAAHKITAAPAAQKGEKL